MDRDSLDVMPAASRREVIAAVCGVLEVDAATAEDLVRSAEPLWDAMERAGGARRLLGRRRVLPQVSARLGVYPVTCGRRLTTAAPGRHPRHTNPRDCRTSSEAKVSHIK